MSVKLLDKNEEEEVDENVVIYKEDETNPEDVSQQTDEQDIDGKGKDGKTRENVSENEDENSENQQQDVDPRDSKIQELENRIEELSKKSQSQPQSQTSTQPRIYSEQEKAAIEEMYGGVPFNGVMAFSRMINDTVQSAIKQIEGTFTGKLSSIEKETVISALSKQKEFSDIRSYMTGIETYLKKFNPIYHGNREILEDAYWYAKGRNLKNAISKVANSSEKNKRIASVSKSTSQSSGGGDKKSYKLTAQEEEAFRKFGGGMTRDEYASSLSRYRKK